MTNCRLQHPSGTESGGDGASNPGGGAHPVETEDQVPIQPEEESHREVDPQDVIHPMAVREFLHPHHRELHHSRQEEQATSRSSRHTVQPTCSTAQRSSFRPTTRRAASWTTQQMLEDWFNKSTFAIAAWRGDAQRYWLDQVDLGNC